MSAIYVHVPFCQSRCIYCDFYSTTHSADWQARYVDALCREMKLRSHELCDEPIHTLYLGGGTPSQLSPTLLLRLFDHLSQTFPLGTLQEVTLEANPDDVTDEWLEAVRLTPVNRISMGLQSMNDDMLRFLRRRHTARQAFEAVERCRKWGFTNLSLDLIYGLPGQTMQQWQEDVDTLLALGTPHLSAYALSIEERTRLWKMVEEGTVQDTDEETQWAMYEYLLDATSRAGMEHYEISNFAKPGLRSQHNSSYWNGTRYLGLGPGAHSFDGQRIRRANLPSLPQYVAATGDVPHEVEHLTDDECYNELVMTRLRTLGGLPLNLLSAERRSYCLRQAHPFIQVGQLILDHDTLRLHRSGIFLSNSIISELMV